MTNNPSFYLTQPFDQDPRRLQPVRDAVQAVKEEGDLEAVVKVVGGERAQDAAHMGRLPDLVRELNYSGA
jgi:hypothetical protein